MIDFSVFFEDEESVIFSCGLLLPQEQADHAIYLSQTISGLQETTYTLSDTLDPAYLKLYEIVMPLHNTPAAFSALGKNLKKTPPFTMNWGELEVTDQMALVWGESNDFLLAFHQLILVSLNKLRENLIKDKYKEHQHLLSPLEQGSLNRWGSPWVDPFAPHLIIAKAKTIFSLSGLNINWNFKRAKFTQLVAGIKNAKQELTQKRIYQFDMINAK
jgi:hypothetical protein